VRRLLVLVLLLPALAGCSIGGGGGDAEDALGETATKLGEIRSGTLDLRLIVAPRDGEEFGFEVHGPFALADGDGDLPVLDVDYTQIVDGRRGTVSLVSTGEAAFAVVDGQAYELGEAQTEELRAASGALGGSAGGSGGGGLEELPIDDWVVDPEVEDGGEVGGAETDRVSGELDIVAATNGLIALGRGLGRPLPRIEGPNADLLRDSARNTRFEVWTGKDDRLLRRLLLEAELGLQVPEELRAALGDLVGATITFELGVSEPNEDVTVKAPPNPRPSSELPGG
jgi:hypothetical protein